MIDTIKVISSAPLRSHIRERFARFQDQRTQIDDQATWTVTMVSSESAKGYRSGTIRLQHTEAAMKIWTNGSQLVSAEASLPRLLHGHNGRLIESEAQLIAARRRYWKLIEEVADPGHAPRADLTRLDLVLHLPIAPARLLPVLRYARSPSIRRETIVYNSTSVVFPGALVRITGYDKSAEMKRGPGHLTRIELSLKKARSIQQNLSHRDFTQLRFDECYRVFRKLVLAFDLPPEPTTVYTEPGLIATCDHNNFRPTGIPVADWAFQSKKPHARRRLQREIAKNLCRMRRIDLGALLPEEGPLPACLEPVLP